MVSVIVPMFNAETSISRCLESIVNQTYSGKLEIIIVNDGSEDNSVKIVEEFIRQYPARDIKLINQVNGGVSKARNTGLKAAQGDFIALLDSDDEWSAIKLERQLQIFESNHQIDFLGCARNNEVLRIFNKKITTLHRAKVFELLIKMYPQTSTALFKRKLYDDLGGFNEELRHGEDGELWIRYCAQGSFFYLPESLVITGNGKPSFGFSGLSANLKAMQSGNEFILREARRKKLVGEFSYFALLLFYKIKYMRRVIITKNYDL